MRNLVSMCTNIVQGRPYDARKSLAGKTIHIVGPRKLENDLLVSFISKETDAGCLVTDFDKIENYIGNAAQKPFRLFLIDYREPRLREILKHASFNVSCSPLVRRFIALLNPSRSIDTADRKHGERACGILYRCDSAAALRNWIYRRFSDADTENTFFGCAEAIGETASTCPLTWRELQLLMLMTEGLQNREIASRIGISSHTVRTHLYNSFNKINARNRLEANAWIEAHISMLYLLI